MGGKDEENPMGGHYHPMDPSDVFVPQSSVPESVDVACSDNLVSTSMKEEESPHENSVSNPLITEEKIESSVHCVEDGEAEGYEKYEIADKIARGLMDWVSNLSVGNVGLIRIRECLDPFEDKLHFVICRSQVLLRGIYAILRNAEFNNICYEQSIEILIDISGVMDSLKNLVTKSTKYLNISVSTKGMMLDLSKMRKYERRIEDCIAGSSHFNVCCGGLIETLNKIRTSRCCIESCLYRKESRPRELYGSAVLEEFDKIRDQLYSLVEYVRDKNDHLSQETAREKDFKVEKVSRDFNRIHFLLKDLGDTLSLDSCSVEDHKKMKPMLSSIREFAGKLASSIRNQDRLGDIPKDVLEKLSDIDFFIMGMEQGLEPLLLRLDVLSFP
jgi:hypothetical protein